MTFCYTSPIRLRFLRSQNRVGNIISCKEGKKLRVTVTKRKFTIVNKETDKKIVVKWAGAIFDTKDHKNYKNKEMGQALEI